MMKNTVIYLVRHGEVVTHGAIIRAFLVKLGYGSYKTIGWVGNGSYVKIETDGIDFFIKETKGVGDKWLG